MNPNYFFGLVLIAGLLWMNLSYARRNRVAHSRNQLPGQKPSDREEKAVIDQSAGSRDPFFQQTASAASGSRGVLTD